MSFQPISVQLEDGNRFVSDGPPVFPEGFAGIDGCRNDRETVAFVNRLWQEALDARRPELERMTMLERYYSGFHYKEPNLCRTLEITNYPFSIVETVWPIMTERRPRPEMMPRRPINAERAQKIQEFATWVQDLSRVDRTRRRNTRVKLKYGMCIHLITIDAESGMPYVVDWSPFDFYPDPSARDVIHAEHFFLAGPVSTRMLRSWYPEKAAEIKPDNYVSPSYDACVRPWLETYAGYEGGRMYGDRITSPDATDHYRATTEPSGSTDFSFQAPGSGTHLGSDTTFLLQLFVRDYGTVKGTHPGTRYEQHAGIDGEVDVPDYYEQDYPLCESGWRMIQITASGCLLSDAPVDTCFNGLPFVVGYDYEHDGRIGGFGEMDHIIPMVRSYNERKNLLNRALRLAAAPIFVASKGSGINFDQNTVDAGAVFEPTRGADLKWLEYEGPSEHHFQHLQVEQRDIDAVAGVHDVQQGQRPAGIEAGVAIRELQDAAAVRIRGKQPGQNDEWWEVVTKLCHVAAKKLKREIFFKATNGEMMSITPEELEGEYDIRAAEGSSTLAARKDLEEKVMNLYGMGLLPPGEVLKQVDYPDHQRIGMIMAEQQLAMAAAGGEANGKAGGKQPPGEKAA